MFIKKIITLAIVTLFSVSTFAEQTPTITQAELVEWLSQAKSSKIASETEKDFIVLDVRTETEFNHGHIKNAINIKHTEITANLDLLEKYKDTTIVVHCRSGRRAIVAEEVLQKHGFSKVRHLEGDMIEWINAELPLVTPNK